MSKIDEGKGPKKMITQQELNQKLQELLKTVAPGNMQTLNQVLFQYLKFCADNYDNLDSEAKTRFDNAMKGFQTDLPQVLEKVPDSKDKRVLKRLHRGMLGQRVMVDLLLKELGTSSTLEDDNSAESQRLLIEELQQVTDFFCDICDNTLSGPAAFGQLSLLGLCVSELVVALHLAQHYYTNQAYSHIRTVIEHADRIELFRKEPKWAELWCSGVDTAIWKELSPKKVRKKLGRPKYDSVYGFFSGLGPHGSFQAVQARTYRTLEQSSKGNLQIYQWLGGCPAEHHIVFVNGGMFYVVHLVMLQLAKSFGHFLNEEEVKEVLEKNARKTADYLRRYFFPWAKNNGLDVTQLEERLGSTEWGKPQ